LYNERLQASLPKHGSAFILIDGTSCFATMCGTRHELIHLPFSQPSVLSHTVSFFSHSLLASVFASTSRRQVGRLWLFYQKAFFATRAHLTHGCCSLTSALSYSLIPQQAASRAVMTLTRSRLRSLAPSTSASFRNCVGGCEHTVPSLSTPCAWTGESFCVFFVCFC
jgi:hypothetical protein